MIRFVYLCLEESVLLIIFPAIYCEHFHGQYLSLNLNLSDFSYGNLYITECVKQIHTQ